MVMKPKFKYITRTICPKTQIHYLDALDEHGNQWVAEMTPHQEPWLIYTKQWTIVNG